MSRSSARKLLCAASCAVWVFFAVPTAVTAQAASDSADCNAAPYRFLRYSEDFVFVRNPACRAGFWDDMKYIPLDGEGERYLTLGGDLRLQLVNARYLSFGTEGGDNHNVMLERIHVHSSMRLAPELRVFAELKSNHEQNRAPRPLGVDVDRLDVHQAFVDLGNDQSPRLRLGRQELVYGAGRRIFPRNGSNVRGSFDAVRGTLPLDGMRVDAFVFRPVRVDPELFDDGTIDTQTFWGVYVDGAPPPSANARGIDVYYIGARRQAARFNQGVATEQRHSVGARLFGKSGAWDFDHEATAQWGSFGAGSIKAWSLSSESGYSWIGTAFKPRGSLRLTFGSGDRNLGDPDLQTFNAFFPRGGVVSEGFNVSPANAMQARLALDAELVPTLTGVIALETLFRTSRRDGIYGPGGAVIRAAGSSTARHVGNDIDAILIWRADRHLAVTFAFGYFFSGDFVEQSGPDRDMSFATATLFYRF